MQKTFLSPFSVAYWRESAREFSHLRILVIAAFIIALRIVVGIIYIPLGENLRMLFKFIPDAVGSLIFGPLLGIFVGAIADILGAFIFPTGAFFPGYTLSAALTYLVFSLSFYRREISVLRIFLARFSTNAFINVLLGSVWSQMLMGKGYIYYMLKSAVKNAVLLVPEVIVILIVFRALMPVLQKNALIPKQDKIKWV